MYYELRGFNVRQKWSNVDGLEPPERVKCWRSECVGFIESLVNIGKWSDGDHWVEASEVSAEVMTKSRMWFLPRDAMHPRY